MKYKRFEELPCWQKARELCQAVEELTNQGTFRKDFGLRDQIRNRKCPARRAEAFCFAAPQRKTKKQPLSAYFASLAKRAVILQAPCTVTINSVPSESSSEAGERPFLG